MSARSRGPCRWGWLPLSILLLGCPVEPGPLPPPTSAAAFGDDGAAAVTSPDGEHLPHSQGPAPQHQPQTDEGRDQLALRPKKQLTVGGVPLSAYLVNTDESRQLGLMFVKQLPEEEGMLFVYPRAGRRSFWMRNTYIPLSLAYIAEDGTIDQLVDMAPLEDQTYPSRTIVRFVLEVNLGWFRRHAVTEGAKVEGLSGLVGYQ